MTAVRCPNCGRDNPLDAEVCRFCQADLRPASVPPFSGEGAPIDAGEAPRPKNTGDLESDLPDWLRDLRGIGIEPETEPGPGGELPDGLQAGETRAEEETPVDESGSPDWLARIRQRNETEQKGSESTQDKDLGVEGSRLKGLESLPGEGHQDVEAQPAEGTSEQATLPDWLTGLGGAREAEETPSPGIPEGQPAPQVPSQETLPETPAEASGEAGDPEWLQRIRTRQQTEVTPPEGISFPPGDGTGVEETPLPPAEPATQLPDWLSGMTSVESAAEGKEGQSETPRWLSQESEEQAKEELRPGDQLPGWYSEEQAWQSRKAPEEKLPDWLSTVGTGEPAPTVPPEGGTEAPAEAPEATPAAEGGGAPEMPDWLSKLEASATEKPPSTGAPALIMDEETGAGFAPSGEGAPEAGGAKLGDANLGAVPDWMSQVSSEDIGPSASGGPEGVPANLEPAQLPSWLEAMRPVESAAPVTPVLEEDANAQLEKAGPLSGMRGILPAEPGLAHIRRKPTTYSIKLQIGEKQQAHKALLEQLLAAEAEAKPLPRPPVITSLYIVRLLLAVVLILAVAVPLWMGQNWLPFPSQENVPKEIVDMNFQVGSLPRGSPVLLAIDYDPGFSGEIETSANAVLRTLLERSPYLVMISTLPSGPVQGERFLKSFGMNIQYANLGFIPGGATGLLGFAEKPRQVVPYDLLGNNVWSLAPLSSITSVANFSLVFVLTENADTARAWVEQVQPFLKKTNRPMVMVISAQAEPMVRPYYEANPKQISGLVAGLSGGAAYEAKMGRPGSARKSWDAFGAGMLVAVIVILLGGLINTFRSQPPSRKHAESESIL